MKTFAVRATDEAIDLSYSENSNQPPFRKFHISYNPDYPIGDNLENIKIALTGLSIDAAIIENSLEYEFSDTIIGINHQKIDIGLAITNMLNVPTVSVSAIRKNGLENAVAHKTEYLKWHLDYYGEYSGKRNYGQEAMLTIGNGYFGLRGAFVEANADKDNYPGMYIAGIYNQLATTINGRDVVNEDLVNLPNSQYISFGVDNEGPFKINHDDIQEVYRSLDLKTGVMTTTLYIQLSSGHIIQVKASKVANMDKWHRFAIEYEVKPINFTGSLQIYSKIDGGVINGNVARYQDFDQHHLNTVGMSSDNNQISFTGQTKTSKIDFVINSRLDVANPDIETQTETTTDANSVVQVMSVHVKPEHTYRFQKNVTVFTSHETSGELLPQAQSELNASTYDDTLKNSTAYWKQAWETSDIQIEDDITSQKLTRINIFHLLVSAAALSSGKIDASIGSRGLHGEAYRGHVFWDVTFDLPFYALHYPAIAKQFLIYRYRRLAPAKKYAKSKNKDGAMYPWQSGQTGDEQSQFVHLNPVSGMWDADNSSLQRHVSLSIAYDILKYNNITGDQKFMNDYGTEMLLSICKFWISMADYNESTKRYDIKHVMGPDEFHEQYPNSDEIGLTNNAYTNIMVSWLFAKVTKLIEPSDTESIKNAAKRADFDLTTAKKMIDISNKLTLDVNEDGVVGQFSGYFKLSKLSFESYRKKYGDISRIDRLLKGEGKSPDAYQVAKQADTLMAYYNLPYDDVEDVLNRLGYQLPTDHFSKTLQFYLRRTTHGSTLSRVVYSVLDAMDNNMDQSWELFSSALFSDYYDIQGGTTAEGIHLGVMGAVLTIETQQYGGVRIDKENLSVNPHLPSQWNQISFKHQFKGITYNFKINHHKIMVIANDSVNISVGTKNYSLIKNKPMTISYK